jgi:uncharacterized membrane protein
VLVRLIAISRVPAGGRAAGAPSLAEVHRSSRNTATSANAPSHPDFRRPPKGVGSIPRADPAQARNIEQQAVLSDIMPLGNTTRMTQEERRMLGAWIRAGARIP